MKVLDLFSGIGGFSLGLERAGMETIAFCEIEEFPRRVLRKHWPDVPIFKDVRKLNATDLPERPDVITGGYPCQPFSTAGKRRGKKDDRHLWPEMFRVIRECNPTWVIAENVAGHVSMGLDEVLSDLESENYTCWTFIIPACGVDAPHKRDRVWILAYSKYNGCTATEKRRHPGSEQTGRPAGDEIDGYGRETFSPVADAQSIRSGPGLCQNGAEFDRNKPSHRCGDVSNTKGKLPGHGLVNDVKEVRNRSEKGCPGSTVQQRKQWPVEPAVGRVVNGIPGRVDRLRGLGNAVVPQIPEIIGRAIMELEGR